MPRRCASFCQKNGRARRQARGCRASAGRTGPVRMAGLHHRHADRKMFRYRSCRPPDTELRVQLREFANARGRFGYRRLFVLIRQQGEPSGKNRIYRLYREEGLSVRKRRVRRRAVGARAPILVEARPNARWSLDFVHDQFANGRRFRILNIVDDVTLGMPCGDPRHLDLGTAGGARADGADRSSRQAWHDRLGQRHRVHLQRYADLVGGPPDSLALHRSGENRCRTASVKASTAGRRASQRNPVLRPRSRPHQDRGLGRRLQQPTPAFLAGLSDARGPCRQTHRNVRSAAQPRPAPPIARCSPRAERRNIPRDSNRHWMKVQGQVISSNKSN